MSNRIDVAPGESVAGHLFAALPGGVLHCTHCGGVVQPHDRRFLVSLPGLGVGAPAPKSTVALRQYLADPNWQCVPAPIRHFDAEPVSADRVESTYNAHADATGRRNYAGLPMPEWADLPESHREAWRVAVAHVERAVRGERDRTEDAP